MTTINEKCINILSWNVRGVANSKKARQILAYLNHHKVDIMLLQETHCSPMTMQMFGSSWGRPRYFFTYSRGVAILVRRSVNFTLIKPMADSLGRVVVVAGQIAGAPLFIVNTYSPNVDEAEFYD